SAISVVRAAISSFNAVATAYIRAVGILGVDVGGTFTDAVFVEDGRVSTAKVPTADRQEESVLEAARAVGARDFERFTHGTTVATNALLERKGARTAFVASAAGRRDGRVRASAPPPSPGARTPVPPLRGPSRAPRAARPVLRGRRADGD